LTSGIFLTVNQGQLRIEIERKSKYPGQLTTKALSKFFFSFVFWLPSADSYDQAMMGKG
jgi:hypothetical protein